MLSENNVTNRAMACRRPLGVITSILGMQLISIMSITRILLIALKPLRQPRIVAEILESTTSISTFYSIINEWEKLVSNT